MKVLESKTIPQPVTEFPEALWKKIRGAAVGTKKVAKGISYDPHPTRTKIISDLRVIAALALGMLVGRKRNNH